MNGGNKATDITVYLRDDRVSRANMLMVERLATEMDEYAHIRKWEHGTLLNSARVFGAPVRLPDVIVLLNTPTSLLDSHPAILEVLVLH